MPAATAGPSNLALALANRHAATTLVGGLLDCGLRHVVISPGARSAP